MVGDTNEFNFKLFLAKTQKLTNVYKISELQSNAKKFEDLVNN
jgi:hypothetical protein